MHHYHGRCMAQGLGCEPGIDDQRVHCSFSPANDPGTQKCPGEEKPFNLEKTLLYDQVFSLLPFLYLCNGR